MLIANKFNVMVVRYCDKFSAQVLCDELLLMDDNESVNGVMVLVADGETFSVEEVSSVLKATRKSVFGGIFPGIIYGKEKLSQGFIIVGFTCNVAVHVIENVSRQGNGFTTSLVGFAGRLHHDTQSMLVFVDGISKQIGALIESIFLVLGLEYNYVGGGCGSLSFKQNPCVFTNWGLMQDAAVVVGMSMKIGVGVSHGWNDISGPFRISSGSGNCIKELNFMPAFELYREVIRQHSNQIINAENFFSIAKSYPFGIQKLDSEKVVRDPFALAPDNSITCVGELEQNSFVYILNGNKKNLIDAARNAAEMAFADRSGDGKGYIFMVDCISRVLFLDEDFQSELDEVSAISNDMKLFGVLSIGEIANNGKDYLDFFNKTTVVSIF